MAGQCEGIGAPQDPGGKAASDALPWPWMRFPWAQAHQRGSLAARLLLEVMLEGGHRRQLDERRYPSIRWLAGWLAARLAHAFSGAGRYSVPPAAPAVRSARPLLWSRGFSSQEAKVALDRAQELAAGTDSSAARFPHITAYG
jgi:hypothetical protein